MTFKYQVLFAQKYFYFTMNYIFFYKNHVLLITNMFIFYNFEFKELHTTFYDPINQ